MTDLRRQITRLSDRPSFRVLAVTAGLITFTALMWSNLGHPDFWLDESITAGHIAKPQHIHWDAFHPPGYYWLLMHWRDVFGPGDIALRSFSALWALLAAALVWLLATRLLESPTDLLALWLFVLSPLGLLYLRTARYFAMTTALFLLVAYLLLLAATGGRWRHYILLGLAAAALLWTNYVAALLLLPGYLLLLCAARRDQPGYLLRWLASGALPVVAFFLLAMRLLHSLSAVSGIPQTAHLQGTLYGLGIKLALPVYAVIIGENTDPWRFYITVPVFLAGGILLVAGSIGARGDRRPGRWLKLWTWPAAVITVVLVFSTVARSEPIVRVTSVALFALPFAYILMARGAQALRVPLLAGVLVAIVFVGDLYGIHNYFTGQQFLNPAYNVPWQQIVDTVRARWQPDDLVIECYDASFRRYWADDTTMIEYRLPMPLADMKPVQQFPKSGQRIWLVTRDRGAQLPRQMTDQIRNELARKANEVQVFNFKPLSPTARWWRSRLLRRPVWDAYIKLYLFVP